MGSLLVVIGVAAVVYIWLRGARANRLRWLKRLDLPGTWTWQEHEGTLELAGELSQGTFRKREAGVESRGQWRLTGHDLCLESAGGATETYDLRFFEAGKIGLRGADAESRVYVKAPSNVVPLRRGNG
jgi:hypothetical protein